MCKLCEKNGDLPPFCPDCGIEICLDVGNEDDVVRRAEVTEEGDVLCSRCASDYEDEWGKGKELDPYDAPGPG